MDVGCFVLEVESECKLSSEMSFIELRESALLISEELFQVAGRGCQILLWEKTYKFCGNCGALNENVEYKRAKICSKCRNIVYPSISPAIIVAVTKGDKILLAHNTRFKAGKYSVLAGFVEPGETLEACVRREVYEEVGILVKNISYFGNQSWPFPNSLMIGFFAKYDSGEINIDGIEIGNAKWFGKEKLPNIPEKTTIARLMIDSFFE